MGLHNSKKKSITVPAHFPSDVTISPGEDPYPPTEEAGGQPRSSDMPPLQLAPSDQQQILPTIPSTVPGRGPTQTTPTQKVYPSAPTGPGKAVGHSNGGGCNTKDGYPSCRFAIGCECDGKKSSEDGGQDGVKVSDLIGNSPSFYAIWNFHAPQGFTTKTVNGRREHLQKKYTVILIN